MKKEPVYQPRGTRDGTAGLKGKTVWVLVSAQYGVAGVVGVFVSRRKAAYRKKYYGYPPGWVIVERKIR